MMAVILAVMLGLVTGMLTGLAPGLHVNVVAAVAVALGGGVAAAGVPPLALAAFIVTVGIVHVFCDIVPTLFLGIPKDEAFALLPTQRMVREGRGLEALRLSLVGSGVGLCAALVAAMAFLGLRGMGVDVLGWIEAGLRSGMWLLLSAVALVLIWSDPRRGWALAIFAGSGILGLVVFSTPLLPSDGAAFSGLFPALSGLFGVSGLILSLGDAGEALPAQREARVDGREVMGASGLGALGGVIAGLLPGLGAANIATLFALRRVEADDATGRRYIASTSAINASDAVFGVAALCLIGRSRSGASVAIERLLGGLDGGSFLVLGACMAVAGLVAWRGLSLTAPWLVRRVQRLPYGALTWGVLAFIAALTAGTCGFAGVAVLAAATLLGMVAPLTGARRAHAMGMFLVPVIVWFSGLRADVLALMRLPAAPVRGEDLSGVAALGMVAVAGAIGCMTYVAFLREWRARRVVPVAGVVLLCLAFVAMPRVASPGAVFQARVVRAVDGDTLVVERGGKAERIRIVDIDSPESGQAYGDEATRAAASLAVSCEVRVAVFGRDRYGRTLGRVQLPDGSDLGERMVSMGLAWRYRDAVNPVLDELQRKARVGRLGLWKDASPMAPWDWRHR